MFLALLMLVTSCQVPPPTSSWAGSRKSERIALMQTFPQLSAEDALRIYPDVDETLVRASWPSTLDQAVTRLLDDMDDTGKKMVRETKKEDLILFHHGWGTGIRNPIRPLERQHESVGRLPRRTPRRCLHGDHQNSLGKITKAMKT